MDDTQDLATYSVTCTAIVPSLHGKGIRMIDPWQLARIVPCRACGGRLLWAENGHVPGYRVCEGCGRSWVIMPRHSGSLAQTELAIEIPITAGGPEWQPNDKPDLSQAAYDRYYEKVEFHGGVPEDSCAAWQRRVLGQ